MIDPDEPGSPSIEEREFVLLIIYMYRDNPVLWQVKSKDYTNKIKRNAALKEIVTALKKFKPNFTEEHLKKKINCLRTNFNKEFQKLELKRRSGSPEDEIEPTLWYYNELLFVKDQQIGEEDSKESLNKKLMSIDADLSKARKKLKKAPSEDMTKKPVEPDTQYFKKLEGEAEIIAKGWAIKLSRLAPDQKRLAEKIINDTLFEAELGTLTRNSVSCTTSPYPTSICKVHIASSE